jgi:GNAT superfamily N-acetyltransferase
MDADDPRQVAAAACLHALLLPESYVPQLGDHFMRNFYYRKLGSGGLIRCFLVAHHGRYVGLMVLTSRPHDFMRIGLRRYFPSLAWTIAWALVRRPGRFGIVWKVFSAMRGRERRGNDQAVGEILTIGVVQDYHGQKFGNPQRTIASQLLQNAFDQVRDWNGTRLQVVTKRINTRSIRFYSSHGFEIDDPSYPDDSILLSMEIRRREPTTVT